MERIEVTNEGRTTSVVIAGEDQPVLLLPGFLQSAQRFVDANCVEELAADFRVVAVDSPGFGDAAKPLDASAHTASAFVSDLAALYEHLGFDQAHIVATPKARGELVI